MDPRLECRPSNFWGTSLHLWNLGEFCDRPFHCITYWGRCSSRHQRSSLAALGSEPSRHASRADRSNSECDRRAMGTIYLGPRTPTLSGLFVQSLQMAAHLQFAALWPQHANGRNCPSHYDFTQDLRNGAFALGSTQWETVWHITLPAASSGIFGGASLALGRALGETMAVTMVIGNVSGIDGSLLSPGNTIPALLANQFSEATDPIHVGALMYLALVLFLVTLTVNALAVIMVRYLTCNT
jgi:hypothetical protein